MKKLISFLIALMFIVNLFAQTIAPESQKLIESFVKSNIDIQLEEVDPIVVSKVFTGTFFKIIVGFIETGTGASSCGSDNYINVNGSAVSLIEPIHMDIECPVLMSIIKKDFLLKDENTAKMFEAALNVLYPVKEDEIQNVKHLHKDSQWIFLRDKFFDDFTAFIVTTGSNGNVTNVELKLGYPVN
ncbi:MAG: hypothetical protein QG611_467 [Bacteroidota bacterium]|nr:hypothetical protein [Bacteroidota bacterium]